MTSQVKKDIKTIIEVITSILSSIVIVSIYDKFPWVAALFVAIACGRFIYEKYLKRKRKDMVLFPTLNDESEKMIPIAIGVIIAAFSVIGYFAFDFKIYGSLIGVAIGIGSFLLGFFQSPNGWLSVNDHFLKIYGIPGEIDTRLLKEITLKNDKITLTNIYGENKNAFNLKLDRSVAARIKHFLEERMPKNEILIIDNVSDAG